jgi:hypothetical protein
MWGSPRGCATNVASAQCLTVACGQVGPLSPVGHRQARRFGLRPWGGRHHQPAQGYVLDPTGSGLPVSRAHHRGPLRAFARPLAAAKLFPQQGQGLTLEASTTSGRRPTSCGTTVTKRNRCAHASVMASPAKHWRSATNSGAPISGRCWRSWLMGKQGSVPSRRFPWGHAPRRGPLQP